MILILNASASDITKKGKTMCWGVSTKKLEISVHGKNIYIYKESSNLQMNSINININFIIKFLKSKSP